MDEKKYGVAGGLKRFKTCAAEIFKTGYATLDTGRRVILQNGRQDGEHWLFDGFNTFYKLGTCEFKRVKS